MYYLTVQSKFAAAHNLLNYNGECEHLHGHNWDVEATVAASELDEAGLAVDFKVFKSRLGAILEELDHSYINEHPAFKSTSPSSENLARFIYEALVQKFADTAVTVVETKVWESDHACAAYRPA